MRLIFFCCIVLLATSVVAVTLGCRSRAVPNQPFQELFEGYQLILVTDLPPGESIDEVDASKIQGALFLDPILVPGRIYVFRKVSNIPTEDMAVKLLPERLAKIGAHVTKGPHSSKDLIYLMVGGPLFNIEFEMEGHEGRIFNYSTGLDKGREEQRLVFVYV